MVTVGVFLRLGAVGCIRYDNDPNALPPAP
jgi:hypothetical protein